MEQIQRSRFITYLAIFSIAAALFLIIEDISNLMLLNSLSSRPEYRMAEQMMPTLSVSPTETIFEMLLQVLGIIASIGMFNRLNWGRKMYIIILSAITIWGIISSYMSYLSLSQYLNAAGMGGSLSLMILGNIIALGITVYLIRKLSAKKVVDEFLQR